MATGMWVSAAGAAAQAQNVDIIANNLANADTLAFKKDMPTFKEYMTTAEREHTAADIPTGPVKDKDLYPLDGRDQAFVTMDGTYTNFKQGNLKVTQSPLDVAMDGPGFLEVSTPQGTRYTRQGSFKIATDGRLVTTEGYPVLASQPGGLAGAPASNVQPSQGGPSTQGGVAVGRGPASALSPALGDAARFINLKGKEGVLTITSAGEVYTGDELVARLNVVEFQNPSKLFKKGGSLYENKDPANNPQGAARTQVRQGVLETSNVNPIEEMTNLIQANRLFEHDLKALKTYGELLGREVNDVGKL